MLFIGLGRTIEEAHFGHWLIRSVVIRHALEQRASELANGFFGNVRQFLTVAQHDETADATLEIGLGAPMISTPLSPLDDTRTLEAVVPAPCW